MISRAARLVLATALSLPLTAHAAEPAPPRVTVLKARRLFDGRADALVTDAVVVVEGSKIKAVGRGLPIPAGATVVDLGDGRILPGFIKCQTHLSFEIGKDYFRDA